MTKYVQFYNSTIVYFQVTPVPSPPPLDDITDGIESVDLNNSSDEEILPLTERLVAPPTSVAFIQYYLVFHIIDYSNISILPLTIVGCSFIIGHTSQQPSLQCFNPHVPSTG